MKTSYRTIFLAGSFVACIAVAAVGLFVTSAQSDRRAKKSSLKTQAASASLSSPASAFTPGNLVIYRVGDGAAALTSSATAVFLDEYTISGTVAQVIPVPTTTAGSNRRLTASGTSTSEGFISRSNDGRYLVFAGYDAEVGTASITSSTSGSVNRVIGRADSAGVVDTTTALIDAISGGNPRGVASTNGVDFWLSGTSSGGGIRYASFGSTTSTSLATSPTNLRVAGVAGGQLYITANTGTTRIATVGTGTPTTTGQTITNLPGTPTTGAPYGFFFADLSAGVAGLDTLYVADDTPGTIAKYSLVGGNWTLNNTVSIATARGLTGSVNGSTVSLFVTNGSSLQTLSDTSGYNSNINGTPAVLAIAPTNTAFRGVALAPISTQKPNVDMNGDGRTDFVITRESATAANVTNRYAEGISRGERRRERLMRPIGAESLAGGGSQFEWWIDYNNAPGGTAGVWGLAQVDFSVSADFDGDNTDDVAIWRPGVPGEAGFYSINSSDGTFRYSDFGLTNDDSTVVGDYDGDGFDDPATFRCPDSAPGQCYFFFRGSLNNPTNGITYIPWGFGTLADYYPYSGDFNGDGKYDFCVQDIKPDTEQATFWLWLNGTETREAIQWGLDSDFLYPGDLDGDGKSDLTVFRYENGKIVFYILERDGGMRAVQWGIDSDIPVPGDYDGDGKQDIAVYRWNTTDATFWILPSNGDPYWTSDWGVPLDLPLAAWYAQ